MKKHQLFEHSLLAIPIIQIALLALSTLSFAKDVSGLGVLFFCAFLIGLAARIWARAAAKNSSCGIEAERRCFFPGESGNISFKVTNDKALGLPWVEFSLPLSTPVVIEPDKGISEKSGGGLEDKKFVIRTGHIGGFDEVRYDTNWIAKRRGVTKLRDMKVVTGDAFGMVTSDLEVELESVRDLVVYPKIVDVSIDLFTQFHWDGNHHPKGVLEDPTVIKTTTPYEDTDSFKDINWRMLARGQEMVVNRYEHIRPDKCHIIFDGQSFDGDVSHKAELEDSLSILASLLLKLEEWGMSTGYSFPKTKSAAPSLIYAEKDNVQEALYQMAAYELREPIIEINSSREVEYRYEDSIFDDAIITMSKSETGIIYFVTYDSYAAECSKFLKELNENSVKVLTYADLKAMKLSGK